MKEERRCQAKTFRFRRFMRKGYAAFCSMHKVVNIGVISAGTLFFALPDTARGQEIERFSAQEGASVELEEVEVAASRAPLSELQAAKMVTVLTRADIQAAAVHSINDLLEYATGVDVRQRGEFGVQTDISVRGGTFDQITLLLNGININNPQTGHHTADFPVSLQDIERIEVLEGPAARVFGTSAFSGAINVVTRNEKQSLAGIQLFGGMYGLLGGDARINLAKGVFRHTVSGGYGRSDGAAENSDFRLSRAYYQGLYASSQTDISWQAGLSNRHYGANTFYSAAYPNQYEETRRYLFSVRAETKGRLRLLPVAYWNRTYDRFQLIRDTNTGENFHVTDVYGLGLNTHFASRLGKTSLGGELRREGIRSTNLGKPLDEPLEVDFPGKKGVPLTREDGRTDVSGFFEHNFLLKRFTLSLGVLANMNTGLDHTFRFYPGVDLSYRPADAWKLFASWNKALRMPTFTDLFYKSPTLQGNVGLRPEETQAVSIGANYRNTFISANASAFYHRGENMIDWVMFAAGDKYHSANFKLDNMGVETGASLYFRELLGHSCFLNKLTVGYTYIYQQRQDEADIYKSNYALEYLKHKLVVRLDHRIWHKLHAGWAFRYQERMGSYERYDDAHQATGVLVPYPSFGLLDLRLSWDSTRYRISVEASNLFNVTYFDYGNIPQPGTWVKGSVSYTLPL